MKRPPINPELLRNSLAEAQGKRYWRSLEELAGDPRVQEYLQREFPDGASRLEDPVSRRRFLSLLGASLALAGVAGPGCSRPTGVIMPYVRQPENLTLGKPLFYATAMTLGGFATGLLAESHEGRPTKIEGNDKHPASLGATTNHHQAAILGMYDPDRSQTVMFREQPRAWSALVQELRGRLNPRGERGNGRGLAVLSETIGSPTLLAQKDEFLAAYPEARWFSYEPLNRDNAHSGARMAFGRPYHCYPSLGGADVIVSLGDDFLGGGPASLALTRQFATRRKENAPGGMNRLYVVETDLTVTGGRADHRLAVRPSQVETVARALASRLGGAAVQSTSLDEATARWVDAVAKDLKARKPGTTAVLTGDGQPPVVHAIAHAINARMQNLGKTILFTEPLPQATSNNLDSLATLRSAIDLGEVSTLLILGGNPAYTAPADVSLDRLLAAQLKNQPREKWLAVRVGPYFDETSRLCHWHVPQSHFLEEWSDGVAFDGTAAIVQPLIAPLYGSKSFHEVLAELTPTEGETAGYDTRSGYEIVRAHWRSNRPAGEANFEAYWQTALHDGVLKGTAWPTLVPTLSLGELPAQEKPASDALELAFAPDPAVLDGRFSNNGWLQEWPKPLTRLSWDNALIMSPATAKKLGVGARISDRKGGGHGDTIADVVLVQVGQRFLENVPVWVAPGHADDAVTLHLGYGRWRAGRVGTKVGVNANALRTSGAEWFARNVRVSKRGGRTHQLACQQAHHSMEGRDIVVSGTVAENKDRESAFRKTLASVRHEKHGLPTLYEASKTDHPYHGYKWGMAIDLSACTGCGACVVACQAENNVPVVGKEQVLRGREMHWLRIDRYFESPAGGEVEDQLRVHFQPVLCQHCENAPCEYVCPTEATAHSSEGLNDMVYNRCVGTRYCSNNCPYKVRRFNFLQYTDYDTPSLKLMYNPEVTVRTRGVMEKCTFCVQRISRGRIEAEKGLVAGDPKRKDENNRKVQDKAVAYIHDEEIYTACEAACPAEAITFGDLNDKASEVRKLRDKTISYDLLGELGVRPRVFYLAGLRNPNPELEAKES
jgi:molybdopterin-containing oxidoreductase family iron-sulfur binding subunit